METGCLAADISHEYQSRYRYTTSGQWYKGNLHLHTNRSDGHLPIADLVKMYAAENFDFVAVTDHWCLPEFNGNRKKLPLLVIDGVELDGFDKAGVYYHVLALGASLKIPTAARNFEKALQAARSQEALLIWAHPHWTGNSPTEGLRHHFHGMEIYNHSSHCENGSGYALSYWDYVLNQHPDCLGFATDDSHFVPEQEYWKGGWIMVNAAACAREEILHNIRRGNFYATQGPEFKAIEYSYDRVRVETSPVAYIRLIGSRMTGSWVKAKENAPLLQAEFQLPSDWPYARIEIEDIDGKRAWSNPLLFSN
ncbi:MAG: CehA/McbA family metallohydrolase [Desulfobacterales bacterium]